MLKKFIRIYNIVCIALAIFFAGCAYRFFYAADEPMKGWYSIFFLILICLMYIVTSRLVKHMIKQQDKQKSRFK